MNNTKHKRLCAALVLSLLLVCVMGTTAFAAGTGDVASAVESTWKTASGQIKTVVNNHSYHLRFYRMTKSTSSSVMLLNSESSSASISASSL